MHVMAWGPRQQMKQPGAGGQAGPARRMLTLMRPLWDRGPPPPHSEAPACRLAPQVQVDWCGPRTAPREPRGVVALSSLFATLTRVAGRRPPPGGVRRPSAPRQNVPAPFPCPHHHAPPDDAFERSSAPSGAGGSWPQAAAPSLVPRRPGRLAARRQFLGPHNLPCVHETQHAVGAERWCGLHWTP